MSASSGMVSFTRQSRTPEERLSALVAIRRDVEVVEASRARREPDVDAVQDGEDFLALLDGTASVT